MKKSILFQIIVCLLLLNACDSTNRGNKKENPFSNIKIEVTENEMSSVTKINKSTYLEEDFFDGAFLEGFDYTQKTITDETTKLTASTNYKQYQKEVLRLEQLPELKSENFEEPSKTMVKHAETLKKAFIENETLPQEIFITPFYITFHQEEGINSEEETDAMADVYYTVKLDNTSNFQELFTKAYVINKAKESRPVELKENKLTYFQYLTHHNSTYIEEVIFDKKTAKIKSITFFNQW